MKQTFYWLLLCPALLAGCSKDDTTSSPDKTPSSHKEITGYVQKGPFITGTSITVQELTNKLVPTGRTFEAQIKEDNGNFKLNGEFSEEYVEIIANGYYFNEITGKLSDSPITLRTLSKIRNEANVNINVLTTLQTPRTQKLIAKGATFEAAVMQSQKEVLKAFHIERENTGDSFDQWNIAQNGEENAILLAISSIMQFGRSEAELSEFISKVANDIENDGTLDSQSLKESITNSASSIDNHAVQENLRKRFEDIGMTDVSIPDFYGYLDSDGDGVLNNKKPYVSVPTDFIYMRKGELTYTLKWAANCTPKIVLPQGCDWIQIEECTNKELVFTLTEADYNRKAVLSVCSSDGASLKEITVEQQGKSMYFQITMRTGASPRNSDFNFFDDKVSDICIIAFDEQGRILFTQKEDRPEISGSTYKCYINLGSKRNDNCTIFTIINSPYDFSGFKGTLSDFRNLQSNVDLSKATNLENFYMGETDNWAIDNSLDQDPSLEKPAPTVLMRHPFAKVKCVVTFYGIPFENARSLTVKGALHISQGSFFKKTTGEGTHFTPDTLVGNQCTFYLYRGSIVNAFDLELVESERSLKDIYFPPMEIEANMSYEFIIKVNRDDFVTTAYNRTEL